MSESVACCLFLFEKSKNLVAHQKHQCKGQIVNCYQGIKEEYCKQSILSWHGNHFDRKRCQNQSTIALTIDQYNTRKSRAKDFPVEDS